MLHPCETASFMRLLLQPAPHLGPPAGHSQAQAPAIPHSGRSRALTQAVPGSGPGKAQTRAAQHSAAGQATGWEQPAQHLPCGGKGQPGRDSAPQLPKGDMSVEGCVVRLGQADALHCEGLAGQPGATGSTGGRPASGSACTAGLGGEGGDMYGDGMHMLGKYVLAWLSFVGPPMGLTVPACMPKHLVGERRCG